MPMSSTEAAWTCFLPLFESVSTHPSFLKPRTSSALWLPVLLPVPVVPAVVLWMLGLLLPSAYASRICTLHQLTLVLSFRPTGGEDSEAENVEAAVAAVGSTTEHVPVEFLMQILTHDSFAQ